MQRSLRVLLDGNHVATLAEQRTNKFTLSYGPGADPGQEVSVRLPWSEDRYSPAQVGSWVAGLLPSAEQREEIAAHHDLLPHLVFRLLEVLGADLPGGAVLSGDASDAADATPSTPGAGRAITENDLSDEMYVVGSDGNWLLPVPGQPSSHLLRVEDEMLPGSAANEAFALRFAALAGVATSEAAETSVLGIPAVVVARADRTVDERGVHRRHLEHFGQICDVDTLSDDEAIYEERGGPGFEDVAEQLAKYASEPAAALDDLMRLMVLHFVTGNTNAHAGTISLRLPERTLAPLDTLLPAELYTELQTEEGIVDLEHRLSMSIAGTFESDEVTRRSLIAEAASWPETTRKGATATIDDFVAGLEPALDAAKIDLESASEQLVAMILNRIDHIRSEL